MKKTVCVDVDGVLAQYKEHGWQGVDHFGDPIEGAQQFLRDLREHFEVCIFTTRCNPEVNRPESAELLRNRVRDWLEKHGLGYDTIWIGRGKPICIAIVDDRAVNCEPEDCTDSNKPGEYSSCVEEVQRMAWGDPAIRIHYEKPPSTEPLTVILVAFDSKDADGTELIKHWKTGQDPKVIYRSHEMGRRNRAGEFVDDPKPPRRE